MRGYFLKRLLLLLPTLLGISIISFILIRLAPGDPAELRLVEARPSTADPEETIRQMRELYGLDQPLHIQYLSWLKRIATLDFGTSLRDHRPIIDKLKERIPVSIKLSGTAVLIAFLIAVPVGTFSATHRNRFSERLSTVFLFGLYSLPNFWIATMAIVFLGGGGFWDVFPVFGLSSAGSESWPWWQQLQDQIWHLILPVACMSCYAIAVLSRYMRASMLETIRQDFVRTARAKGLSESAVMYRHAVRNSLIPLITLVADILPAVVGGSIVTEFLFSIPGMGALSYEAVYTRDYPLLMGIFTLSALVTLIGILISDFLYTLADPRITYDKRATA